MHIHVLYILCSQTLTLVLLCSCASCSFVLRDLPYYKQDGWKDEFKSEFPYFEATIYFTVLVFLVETYLQVRQHRTYSLTTLPNSLLSLLKSSNSQMEKINDKFIKSQDYGKDKRYIIFASSLICTRSYLLLHYYYYFNIFKKSFDSPSLP
jgi:hypothetical protein